MILFHFQFYQFTYFAMTLNEIPPDCKPPKTLCPTDSRLRPDIRKLETGDLDAASSEKNRLEEKQRDARKALKARKEEWAPKYVSIFSSSFYFFVVRKLIYLINSVITNLFSFLLDGFRWESIHIPKWKIGYSKEIIGNEIIKVLISFK